MLSLLLYIFLASQTSSRCPSKCQRVCSIPGDICNSCLNIFFQVYSLNLQTCICQTGFTHFLDSTDYCCPAGCESCGTFGCSTCDDSNSHMVLEFVDFFVPAYLNCSCNQNFYLNTSSNKCLCLSETSSQLYYPNSITGECFKCPPDCSCSVLGCISCLNSTYRIVRKNQLNQYVCPCILNYREYDGVCSCPRFCNCTNDGVIQQCSNLSQLVNLFGVWICRHPFRLLSGVCSCFFPYTLSQRTSECICSSQTVTQLNTNLDVYLYQGVCYQCLGSCTCNHRGCVSCPNTGKYLIANGTCFCSENYTRVDSSCVCGNPYYEIQEGICKCMSELSTDLFYYDSVGRVCRRCPSGCLCSDKGCFQCSGESLRRVTRNSKNQSICRCGPHAIEINEKCYCLTPFVRSLANTCICNNNTNAEIAMPSHSLIFLNIDNDECIICPLGCTCSSQGCIACQNHTLRTHSLNEEKVNICDCIANARLDSFQLCQCVFPYTLNFRTLACQCQEPYYKNGSQCLCKSTLHPSQYYWNFLDHSCKPCPKQCICSEFGCVSCTNDSLRYIVTVVTSVCDCFQQALSSDNTCSICSQGYFYNNQCIPCLGCLTCNRSGCTSCDLGLNLIGFQCFCDDPSKVNWNGTCLCRQGTYYIANQCRRCPPNCEACELFGTKLQCTSCSPSMNRLMTITSGCDCVRFFKESYPMKPYCCHRLCEDCDLDGCTSCYFHSFRTLINRRCQCVFPFVDTRLPYCVCQQGYYLLSGECLSCPKSCKTCEFDPDNQSIICVSCQPSSNRNTSSSTCECLTNYSEADPPAEFCVPYYCESNTINCTSCLSPRVLVSNKCVCPNGTHQSYFFTCMACSIKGCLICLSVDICTFCNISDNYYLTSRTCTKRNLFNYLYTYRADHSGVVVQFVLNEFVSKIRRVQVNIFEVGTRLDEFQSPTRLTVMEDVERFLLTYTNLVTLTFKNANITYQNVLISFVILYQPLNDTTVEHTVQYSLLHKTVYSDTLLSMFQYTTYCILVIMYVFIVMILALLLHVYGYKHNQIMFSLQTMSYCVFALYKPSLYHISVLYYLRASYFGFGSGAFVKDFPEFYIESSPRNYRFLTKDANFLRVAGIPTIITIVLGVLILSLRLCYAMKHSSSQIPTKSSKDTLKVMYRVFQFFYKLMMYPMMFFTIQTFFNWNIYMYTDTHLKVAGRVISTIIFVIYFGVTVFEFKHQLVPRSSKIQFLNQYFSTIITSIFIIYNQKLNINDYLIVLVFPLFARDFIYIYNLYKYWEFVYYSYLTILIPTFFQVIPLCVMLFMDDRSVLFGSIVALNILQLTIPLYVMRVFRVHLQKDKVTVAMIEKEQNITSKHLNDITDCS